MESGISTGHRSTESSLEQMVARQAFRGPDMQGIHIEGSVGLGHTLAKTTEESERENQPASLDGRVWIVTDARIDGREEARRAASRAGIRR